MKRNKKEIMKMKLKKRNRKPKVIKKAFYLAGKRDYGKEVQRLLKRELVIRFLHLVPRFQILIQHIFVFSFLLEKSIMDGVYVIFILVEHHLSFFFYFYILEELYLMVHTFIIQILGFQEFFFSSS